MNDQYNLNRFVIAQNQSFEIALKEIEQGEKRSHWMWYVFPQFKGLGRSVTSQKYAIKSISETKAYYHNEILGKRLIKITEILLNINDKSAFEIFGRPDNFKLKSCMSLFVLVIEENEVFQKVLDKYFDGKIDKRTEQLLLNENG